MSDISKRTGKSAARKLCIGCAHYFVTWDAGAPHGCKAMSFKSRNLPSAVVFESSGMPCLHFLPRSADSPAD